MENADCVRVALHIRPLITSELLNGCTDCITVVAGESQVQMGAHSFTYDHVFGSTGKPSAAIYEDCVSPLVDAFFHGYNATVLAYGQTGSGKTYTMGTNYNSEENSGGIISKVIDNIFHKVELLKESVEFLIRVSFIEIFKEEVFDLLDPNLTGFKNEGTNIAKHIAAARGPIQIRETVNGGITLAGVTEPEVRTKEEMASFLLQGSFSRATGSTNMNSQSSRSHAIFTITMEQKKVSWSNSTSDTDVSDDILCAKLHLVDLAGSERAKRTGADSMRLKEGIHINRGLLALGNVISALGDEKKRKDGCHVPYRDSKLTRLLQDSLGGNSKTLMIACVSPAEINAEETLNTLKYANRARNIQNKAIVNRDPVSTQMQQLRSQIEQLQSELLFYRNGTNSPFDESQILKHKLSLLEANNAELRRELEEGRITCEHFRKCAFEAQVEKDKLLLKMEAIENGKSFGEGDCGSVQEIGVVKKYIAKIQDLEGELLHLQNLCNQKHNHYIEYDCLDANEINPKPSLYPSNNEFSCNAIAEPFHDTSDEEKELEHSSLQEKLDNELKELDKTLEQKEAEMKRYAGTDTSVLKLHYERKVQELEHEKKSLQREIEDLRLNLASLSSISDDNTQKLKETYLQKLTTLEAQVSELKKKQEAQSQLLRQKQRSDDAAKRLHEEIQRIKTQKVQLQHKIKQESEQFRIWKASRDKEVLQLKKEGRRNEFEMHKLLALNHRQKMVLQRKTEEAALATKRLKELLESRKASSRENSSSANSNAGGIQALVHTIQHELEVIARVHEVRSEYERQVKERGAMAKEILRLKNEAHTLKSNSLSNGAPTMSPGARNSRIFALENMLATSSSTLVSMASQLSEAEETERGFSGKGRWNQVRSIVDAKTVMNYLFNMASSSRCALRDREADCREKDTEMKHLKEKVLKLSSLARHLEAQNAELVLENSSLKKFSTKNEDKTAAPRGKPSHPKYDLRKQARSSMILMEDMDTSQSEFSEVDSADDEWVQSDMDMGDEESMKLAHKRASRFQSHTPLYPENPATDTTDSGADAAAPGLCCQCSSKSSCKTSKCQCRAAHAECGPSCNCVLSKCSNRGPGATQSEEREDGNLAGSDPEEIDKNRVLATHGAMLLQSALDQKLSNGVEDGTVKRKPLSDIGNTTAKPNVPKPKAKKKWRKSMIQINPVAPPVVRPDDTPTSPVSRDPENGRPVTTEPPNHTAALQERIREQHAEMVRRGAHSPRSPSHKTLDGKDNC